MFACALGNLQKDILKVYKKSPSKYVLFDDLE